MECFRKILYTIKIIFSKNIFHCDIKFENIVMDGNNPIIIDFDHANVIGNKTIIGDGRSSQISSYWKNWAKTPGFFNLNCPSHISNQKNDLFSIGCMLYYHYYEDNKVQNFDKLKGNLIYNKFRIKR
jgi:serine/threonine protein kinase